MKEGVSRGRELLQEHCSFEGEALEPSSDGAESDEAETDDEEEEVEDIDSSEELANVVTVYGDALHHDTAVEVCLNECEIECHPSQDFSDSRAIN